MASNLLKDLRSAQLKNLRKQVDLLMKKSPFYIRKLHDVELSAINDLSFLAQLPYTTSEEVRAAGPFGLLLSDAAPEAYYQSSGTTGHPTVGFPDLSPDRSAQFGSFLDHWMGLRKERITRAIVNLAYELSPVGYRFQAALPYAGVMVIPCGVRTPLCPPETLLELIHTLEPEVIFSRPFELLRIADAIRASGKDPADTSIRKVFMLGEPVSMNKWRRIGAAWDRADCYAHYGLTETDSGLHTCAEGAYHEPLSPTVHIALIDRNGLHIEEPEKRGEIVISVLRQAHAPLLNYRTGDLAVRLPGLCPCSLPTPRYRIIGREADGFSINGRLVFPVDLEEAVFDLPDVGNEYLFIITSKGGLMLLLERAWESETSLKQIARYAQERVSAEFQVNIDVEVCNFGDLADKLGLAIKKSVRFTDLRSLSQEASEAELRLNILDSQHLRDNAGKPFGM